MEHAYYCEEHNREFRNEHDYNQHMNSRAHEFTYYCEEHNREFRNEHDYNQHMNSRAHEFTYYCEEHNREFRNEHDYNQHMNSRAHFYDYYYDYDYYLNSIPIPVPTPGYWVYREEFTRTKSFGYFECFTCQKWWLSAHSFPIYKQGCQECNTYSLPICLWENENPNKNLENNIIYRDGSHDRSRCEACTIGVCKQN